MSTEIEIEFKNMVTHDEFLRINQHFSLKNSDFISQENHYFDTKLFSLKKNNCALRIRRKNNRYELTLKQPAEIGLIETNEIINSEVCNQILSNGILPDGEVKMKLMQSNLPFEDISCFGTLTTNRAEIKYLGGLLVFDHSFYLKKEDFEIEYEVTDREIGKKHFIALMDQLNIPIRETNNKILRFYNEALKQKQTSEEEK
ncbi:putative triphosphatase YjbK [Heyndrickxia sporothermodurans]|nr:putative triphosphatase YjbK [Heyndrickxia sporothermodurans]